MLPNLPRWSAVVSVVIAALMPQPIQAQIAGDGTLGTQVNGALTDPCTGSCVITNGTVRGSNLFHSLRQFSLPNGDLAAFVTNPTIQNVIVRVTGRGDSFISNINGTIVTTNPTVTTVIPSNFFLLNPNGIIFGSNARLLNGGSFLATTAERILFQDGTFLNTTTDQPPLLTISVPVGLQFGQTPGMIQATGLRLGAGINSRFRDFALVGGDVTLNNSIVLSPGQRIELASVGDNGFVGLQLSDRLKVDLAADTPRRDITLINGSRIDVAATYGNGEIVVTGNNIFVDNSTILTGILAGIDNATSNQAGDITISATRMLQLHQRSFVYNLVNVNAIGQGGDITIAASDIQVYGGSTIAARTLGVGDAGNISIKANAITVDGTTPDGQFSSGIGSNVGATGRGNGGNIAVETGSLTVTNGAVISATTRGNGQAGNVQVKAHSIAMDGTTPNGQFGSGIFGNVANAGSGGGGNVTVETDSLTVTHGAAISASTSGDGRAGNVRIKAHSIILDGTSLNSPFASGVFSNVDATGSGHGGDVTVETDSLAITNGAVISANTFGDGQAGNVRVKTHSIILDGTTPNGQAPSGIGSIVGVMGNGNGGNILVETDSITVSNGAVISANTYGDGKAGNIRVNANSIALDSSEIASQVAKTGKGSGGDVSVETALLTVTNGAVISTNTFGIGKAGNIRVHAHSITLDSTILDGQPSSGIFSEVANTGSGNGGDISVETGSLTVTHGAAISATTRGNGQAGNVQVKAHSIVLDGTTPNGQSSSAIASQVDNTGSGSGGDVTIETGSLTATNGAGISVSTSGNGQAGNIRIKANSIALDGTIPNSQSGSGIASQVDNTGRGNGGDITVETDSLTVTNGAAISASTFGTGKAGNVRVKAYSIALNGTTPNGRAPSAIVSEVGNTGSGSGGDITVETDSLVITNRAEISVGTRGNGNAGDLMITARDRITLNNGGISTASLSLSQAGNIVITTPQLYMDNRGAIDAVSAAADGGNITLNIRDLLLMRRGSLISATAGLAEGSGDGGNITINAAKGFVVGVKSENSDIAANAFTGSGGRVNITAQGIYGLEFRPRLTLFSDITASSDLGSSGVVTLNTPDIDPSRGLQQLPVDLVDPSNQIDQSCAPGNHTAQSKFEMTGRGGLPENPFEPLRSREAITNWVELPTMQNVNGSEVTTVGTISPPPELIVEADRWLVGKDGQVTLVASYSKTAQREFWTKPSPCPAAAK